MLGGRCNGLPCPTYKVAVIERCASHWHMFNPIQVIFYAIPRSRFAY